MDLSKLSDRQLLDRLDSLASLERRVLADSLACMAELERRRVLPNSSLPSLFRHCVTTLGMAEETAYKRVRAAHVVTWLPDALSLLREGEINLTTITLIEPYVRERPSLLQDIRRKTRREVERMIAAIEPEASKPDRIRIISAPEPPPATSTVGAGPEPELFAPSSPPASSSGPPSPPLRAEIRFDAGEDFVAAIDRVKALLWHRYPDGKLEDVLLVPLREFIERRDPARPRRKSAPRAANPGARRPPAPVERAVRVRDGERCAFVDASGRRCEETRGLEIDHVLPWALGGRSDDPGNLRLLCRAHNQREMRRMFRREAG